MFLCILCILNAIIDFFKKRRVPVWNDRLTEITKFKKNCKKLEESGFGPHVEDNVKGICVSNVKIDICENYTERSKDNSMNSGKSEDMGMYPNTPVYDIPTPKIHIGLSNHLTLLGLKRTPHISRPQLSGSNANSRKAFSRSHRPKTTQPSSNSRLTTRGGIIAETVNKQLTCKLVNTNK